VQLKAGFDVNSHVRLYVGYDFLYWNEVVRPGNEIDRTLNLSQSTVLLGGGTLVGAARPAPEFNQSSFWLQGLTFGVELRW
jgi:hypothetical protein